MTRVAILDYGMGNLRSVEKAFERVGASPEVTNDHERVREAAGVVLPGVGAFPKAMGRIRELGLDDVLRERLEAGMPVLGICLGFQLLFERSTELGGDDGLGLLGGGVEELRAEKVPQIGWNAVTWVREAPLNKGLPNPCAFYHVHSFAPRPSDPGAGLGVTDYVSQIVTAVARDNLFGVQFHPEKSGEAGLRLLANFTEVCTRRPATVG